MRFDYKTGIGEAVSVIWPIAPHMIELSEKAFSLFRIYD
jgi:hypothetical protein